MLPLQQKQTEALGTQPIGKLLLQLAAPAVAAQIINLLYNLVDRMYIGHIAPTDTVGRVALTGVGVCLPLIMIISAFAALAGQGAAPRASIYLGKGETAKAEEVLGNATSALVFLSVVLTAVFYIFAEPMLLAFGANDGTGGTDNTLLYGFEYLRLYSLGTLFVLVTLGLNTFISAQGFTVTSMLTVLLGAVCNIILDPIFIFGLDMGVRGAALATILSQAVSMIWILKFLTGKKTTIRIRLRYLKPNWSVLLPSLALGLSPFIMMATESLIAVCFNTSLRKYGGDLAVGAMTILSSVMQFSMLPLQGLTQGAQPIISYTTARATPTGSAMPSGCKSCAPPPFPWCFGWRYSVSRMSLSRFSTMPRPWWKWPVRPCGFTPPPSVCWACRSAASRPLSPSATPKAPCSWLCCGRCFC